MIKSLIDKAIKRKRSFRKDAPPHLQPSTLPATPMPHGVPTLKPQCYRACSDLLAERYALLGRWERATHGHWLGISDMEALWHEPTETLLQEIKAMRQAGEDGWPDEASVLFKPERLSLFAGSDISNEKIYLLWLDDADEPEFWVYDSNGETRYRDIRAYLEAYLTDDLSAVGRSWRAGASP